MKQSSLSPARLAALAARPRKSSGFTVSCGLACFGLLAPPLTAGHIIFADTEVGGLVDSPVDANDYLVENWSDTAVAKTFDVDGNNFYGSDGYYQITPSGTGESWSEPAPEGNDLGITLVSDPRPGGQSVTLFSKPSFLVTNPTGGSGNYYIFETNPFYSNPAGNAQFQQGSLAVSITDYEAAAPGEVLGNWCKAFTFTLSQAASFRLGVAVDTVSNSEYAPDYVSVSNVDAGEVFSTDPLTRNGVSDMVFFDIKGSAGDEFAVNLWQTNTEMNTGGPVAFGLITFDRIPVPILSYARDGGNFTLSWQPQITGWTLESSTNLAPDSWTPVPDVANNHVSVPMTGVPKKFFRLKEIP